MASQPELPVVGKVELAYRKWRGENPAAMMLIRGICRVALARGQKTSFWLIINRVRWEMEYEWTPTQRLKINNNHIAPMARQMSEEMPGRRPLVTWRPLRGRRMS